MNTPSQPEIVRSSYLAPKVIFVDGQFGCGKTMLSPIIAALDRVELLTYAYPLEQICSLYYLKKIDKDATIAMIRTLTDLQIYNTMMSREINFRFSDLSSAFKNRPWRYIKRIFQKGDEAVVGRIRKENPILHLTTHNLLSFSDPVFSALNERMVLIEVVRHPLYMIKQQILNMERLLSSVRHFTIYFKYNNQNVPFWAYGWEELFLRSNPAEKAIYLIDRFSRLNETKRAVLQSKNTSFLTVCFENFVIDPWPYLKQIEDILGTRVTSYTRHILKKQNVPRARYAEGISLPIYKHCGWEPPKADSTENDELEKRRRFVEEQASPEAMLILDKLCDEYEAKYLGGIKKMGDHYI